MSFEIKEYIIAFMRTGGRGMIYDAIIKCDGANPNNGETVFCYFVDDNTTTLPNNSENKLYFRRYQYEWLIDLLRNEKPVHVMTNGVSTRISTSKEPVGEGEI